MSKLWLDNCSIANEKAPVDSVLQSLLPVKKRTVENMRCSICHRESGESNYCQFHLKAHKNMTAKYEQWKVALNISWKGYLSEIAENPLAGEWVKEVAQHLMLNRGQRDVKKCQEKRL